MGLDDEFGDELGEGDGAREEPEQAAAGNDGNGRRKAWSTHKAVSPAKKAAKKARLVESSDDDSLDEDFGP